MGYIEPLEFAGLGLLAIAFVSISSPDDGMRKLGYEALGNFKDCLEVITFFYQHSFSLHMFSRIFLLQALGPHVISGQ